MGNIAAEWMTRHNYLYAGEIKEGKNKSSFFKSFWKAWEDAITIIDEKDYEKAEEAAEKASREAWVGKSIDPYGDDNWGRWNAYQHARWNQLMAKEIGPSRALMISSGYEIFKNGLWFRDQTFFQCLMDFENNFEGALSGKHPDQLMREGKLQLSD